MLGFRSSIGCDDFWGNTFEIVNIASGEYEKPGFCSAKPGPGCMTMLPFAYDNTKLESRMDTYQYLMDEVSSWKDTIEAIPKLRKFMWKMMPRLKNSKGMTKDVFLERFQDCTYSSNPKHLNYRKRTTWTFFETWMQ